MPLTGDEIAFFQENGFIGPVKIISPTEMSEKADKLTHDILVESTESSAIYGFHSNRDVHLYSRELLQLCTHPELVQCLTQLLGPDVILWRTTAFYKPSAGDSTITRFAFGEIDWHQGMDFIRPAVDTNGLHPSLGLSRAENLQKFPLNITAWIAINEATEESGTLVFAPGSHRLGPVPYVKVEDGEGFHNMGIRSGYKGLLDTSQAVVIPVPPGSCLLFNNLVFHRSLPNLSRNPRLGVACRYVGSHVPVYHHGDPSGLDISNWGCIVVAGRPDSDRNKILDPSSLQMI